MTVHVTETTQSVWLRVCPCVSVCVCVCVCDTWKILPVNDYICVYMYTCDTWSILHVCVRASARPSEQMVDLDARIYIRACVWEADRQI